jgi:parallel beta-helix repeat protein
MDSSALASNKLFIIRHPFLLLLLIVCACLHGCQSEKIPTIARGMLITQSISFPASSDTLFLPGADSLDQPILTISGDDIEVDFGGLVLVGNPNPTHPELFTGLGIRIENGKNVTLRNLSLRGFKVGILAENVENLTLINLDASYNYRPRLKSRWDREDMSDWLSYHDNESDEWLRYGAAFYLKNCTHFTIKEARATHCQNALLMSNCQHGTIFNNTFQFNSGLGLGLYRSSHNQVMHNKLDWNVRGYSHGNYARGQDSAGILCYEQSSNNTFAYNSATHSGDGFFLWAGNSTMETGQGGCNDNLIFHNDFSYAPTNGIEVTFSRNTIVGNTLEECKYGIWGGYSYETLIEGNEFRNNRYGIAIEHGQSNKIRRNLFEEDSTAIRLWERPAQPSDWGYAKARDVRSSDYQIEGNQFFNNQLAIQVAQTNGIQIKDNQYVQVLNPLDQPGPNTNLAEVGNQLLQASPTDSFRLAPDSVWVNPMAEGFDTQLDPTQLKGQQYILMTPYGPYDFQSPAIFLREINGDEYTFLFLGPEGNWKIEDGEGWASITPKTGTFPATVVARKSGKDRLAFQARFIGTSFVDPFGRPVAKGAGTTFSFQRFEPATNWIIEWHHLPDDLDPIQDKERFLNLSETSPERTAQQKDLFFAFWGAPGQGLPTDRFATFAETSLQLTPGKYRLIVTSDDGMQVRLDGKVVIDNWGIHTPETDEVLVQLGGSHKLEVYHFNGGGFATLDVRLEPVW